MKNEFLSLRIEKPLKEQLQVLKQENTQALHNRRLFAT